MDIQLDSESPYNGSYAWVNIVSLVCHGSDAKRSKQKCTTFSC